MPRKIAHSLTLAFAFGALPLLAQTPVRLPQAALDSAAKAAARADSLKKLAAAPDTSGDTVTYSARRIRFSGDRFSLSSGALMKYKGATLHADSIIYYSDLDIVDAIGAPLLEDPTNPPLLGYRMRYNLKNRVGTVYYGSSEKDGQVFYGNEVRRQPDGGVYIARADLTTCDQQPTPHYHFYARRMIVSPESQALSGPIVMNIAEVPVAVLPMMVMPLGKGRRSGLLQPKFGGDQTQGFYLQNLGYYWALSDYHDFLLSADVVEGERGTFDQTNLNATYQWNRRYFWSGTVGGKLYVPQFQPERAGGYIDFRNDLNITPDGRQTLKGSGRLQSDPDVVENNALSEEERLQQTANANLGYRRQFDRAGAVLNVDAAQDYNLTQHHIIRDIPNVTFSASGPLVPVSEDDPDPASEDAWYRTWTWSYNNRFNVNQVIRPTVGTARGDSTTYMGYADNATISGKYTALRYFNLTPSLNASQLWSAGEKTGDTANPYRDAFNPTQGELGEYFAAWNASISADTRIYGIAQADGDPWFGHVAAARHTITPSVSFTYAPEIDTNRRFFGNPRIGGAPYQSEQKSVGFALGNDVDLKLVGASSGTGPGDTVNARKEKPQSYKLLSANSTLNYNFAADVRPWSSLTSNVSLYLTRNVALSLDATHELYDQFRDPTGYATGDPSSAANQVSAPVLQSWGFGWRKGLEVAGGFNNGLRLRDTRGLPSDDFEQTPWSASLNYGFDFRATRVGTTGESNPAGRFLGLSQVYNVTRTHQATAGFKFSPTAEWKMTYDTEFNFTEGQFSRHNFGFERTLHCWRMNFSWTPVGVSQGWYFVIRVIDLPDIKLETRDTKSLNRS
ncbi:MAG TPA: putative LPS assembly protein LptD [Fibrobacteria bacterium]|jgi:hypothetical protein|nr:putative LPS assembly protein LptD [Fibrobacteria bacterium]